MPPCLRAKLRSKRRMAHAVSVAAQQASENAQIAQNKSWLGLEGKGVIVTGGASGLGKAIATEFARCGARVAIIDVRSDDEGWATVSDISSRLDCKAPLVYLRADIRDTASTTAAVHRAVKENGAEILVNNAGINEPALLVDMNGQLEVSRESLDRVFGVNVFGVVHATQEFARLLIKHSRRGVIVNISSESGAHGSVGQGLYAASKAALDSLTKTWSKELASHGIRVVAVAPGVLETTGLRTPEYENKLAYSRGISVEKLRSGYTSSIPLGREARLSEVANVVAFLASSRSSYITGAELQVTGGKS